LLAHHHLCYVDVYCVFVFFCLCCFYSRIMLYNQTIKHQKWQHLTEQTATMDLQIYDVSTV